MSDSSSCKNEDFETGFLQNIQKSKLFGKINPNICFLKYLDSTQNSQSPEPTPKYDQWNNYLQKNSIKNVFPNDLRLLSVYNTLQYHHPATLITSNVSNETELFINQKLYLLKTLSRTFCLPYAMSAFSFSTGNYCFPEKLNFPPLSLAVKFPPTYSTAIEATHEELEYSTLHFVLFGNGLCYGLSFPSNSDRISHSWLNLNRSVETTAEFAGFIFGLSLIGNHSFLNFSYVGDLLNRGISILSVSVLLSVGLRHRSTSDADASALISAFVPSFCANGENETEGTLNVQMAALISAGFIFLGTANKPIVEYLMDEIVRNGVVFLNAKSTAYKSGIEKELYSESYRFCAAIAIGLICNGFGNTESKINAIKSAGVIDSLFSLASDSFSAEPALLALTLIYFSFDGPDEKVKIPKISTAENSSPLKMFFVHLFESCANLNAVIPLHEIVDSIENSLCATLISHVYESVCKIYELAANCVALAVKYASSCDESIFHYFQDIFSALSSVENEIGKLDPTFSTKMLSSAVFLAINSLFLCLSTVFAGSGELKILKLFRFYHDRSQPFSRHYALHLSIGILMLGCGRSCLTSKTVNQASFLLLYLLPFFPSSFNDNSFFFQPIRSFWSLSIQAYRIQNESEVSLENPDVYEFIEKVFCKPSPDSVIDATYLESSYLKSEFFNIFKCGMAPKKDFLKKLEFFISSENINAMDTNNKL